MAIDDNRRFRQRAERAASKARRLLLEIERDENNNPTTLEGVVRSMILKSPDMIGWRDDALNVLYCVLGSGIEWDEHGRLADTSPNNYMNLPPDIHYGPWSEDFGFKDSFASVIEGLPVELQDRMRDDQRMRMERDLKNSIAVVTNIDVCCQTYRPNRIQWYPISWYACHLCVPVNVQQDFLDGAIEIAALISNWRVPLDGKHYWSSFKTVEFCKAILPILLQRKAHSGQSG